jgi:hypothetical protein
LQNFAGSSKNLVFRDVLRGDLIAKACGNFRVFFFMAFIKRKGKEGYVLLLWRNLRLIYQKEEAGSSKGTNFRDVLTGELMVKTCGKL